jgi:superfamily I DNA and/or RNA helicase/stress response protein SCP2/very-short-patch-repair endonuclease
MIDSLTKGQRINLSNYLNDLKQVRVDIIYELDASYSLYGSDIKISAFCLNENKKFLNESYLVNSNNSKTPCNGIHYYRSKNQETAFSFLLDFSRVENSIKKIILVLSMGDGLFDNPEYNKIFKSLEVRLSGLNNEPFLNFQVPFEFSGESTVEFFEIYYKDFQWKVAAQSMGYIGGLSLLTEKYGLIIEEFNNKLSDAVSKPESEEKNSDSGLVINEPLDKKLKIYRDKLLDLSKRNPLINMRVKSVIEFSEPDMYEIFEKLFDNSETLTLTTIQENQELYPLEKNEVRVNRNKKEGTNLLSRIRRRANSALEEQGVNILYLAIGKFTWSEIETSNDRFLSPILLLPVELYKVSINTPYKFRILEEEIIINPALNVKLINQFAVGISDLPEENDVSSLRMYFSKVREELKDVPNQKIEETCCLGIFSFNRLVLYNDLEKYNNLIKSHPVINGQISSQMKNENFSDITAEKLDEMVSSKNNFQVLDADSSQQEAILLAKKGASFVLQGPPGTGKSQTITNIISECISDGKSVLFVSEKMAALEVVKKRMENCGMGDFCLELHGQKVVKKNIILELDKTLQLNKKVIKQDVIEELNKLDKIKSQLNNYVQALHKPQGELKLSTFHVQASMASLDKFKMLRFSIPNILEITYSQWEEMKENVKILTGLESVFTEFEKHPWKNTVLKTVSLENEGIVKNIIDNILNNLNLINQNLEKYYYELNLKRPENINELNNWLEINEFILSTPFPLPKWIDNSFDLQPFTERIINIEKQVLAYKRKKSSFLENYNQSSLQRDLLKGFDDQLSLLLAKYNANLLSSFVKSQKEIDNTLDNLKSNFEKLKVQNEKIEVYTGVTAPVNTLGLNKLEKLLDLIILEPKVQTSWYEKEKVKNLIAKTEQMQKMVEHKNRGFERFTSKYDKELLTKLPEINDQFNKLYNIFSNNLPEHFISKKKEIDEIFISLNYNFEKLEKCLDSINSLCNVPKPKNFFEIEHYQVLLENIIKEPQIQESWYDSDNLEKIIINTIELENKTKLFNDNLSIFTNKYKSEVITHLPELNKKFMGLNDFLSEKFDTNFINEENIIKESLNGAKTSFETILKTIDNISEITSLEKPANFLEYEHFRSLFEILVKEPEVQESWYDDKILSTLFLKIEESNQKTENYKQKYQTFINKYSKDILDLDIEKLITRFEGEFKGTFKRLFDPVYKADFKQIASLANNSSLKYADVLDILKAAELVHRERKWFSENRAEFIQSFGDSYIGENTDWNKIKRDVLLTKKITKWFSTQEIPQKLKNLLKNGGMDLIKFKKLFEELEINIENLKKFLENLKAQNIEVEIEKGFKNSLDFLTNIKVTLDNFWALNNTLKQFSLEDKVNWANLKNDLALGLELAGFRNYCIENNDQLNLYFGILFKSEKTDWPRIKEDLVTTRNLLNWFPGKSIPNELKNLLKNQPLELKSLKQVYTDFIDSSAKIKNYLDRFNKANIIIEYQSIGKTINAIHHDVSVKRENFSALWAFYSKLTVHLRENNIITWNQLNEDLKLGFELIDFENYFVENKEELKNSFGTCFMGSETNWTFVKEQLQITEKILSWFSDQVIPEKLKELLKQAEEISKLKQLSLDLRNIEKNIETDFDLLNSLQILISHEELNSDFEVIKQRIINEKEIIKNLWSLNLNLPDYLRLNINNIGWESLKNDFSKGLEILDFENYFSEQYRESLEKELDNHFKGLETDWAQIIAILDWSEKFRQKFAKGESIEIYQDLDKIKSLVTNNNNLFSTFKEITEHVKAEHKKLSKQISDFKKFFINEEIEIKRCSIEATNLNDINTWFLKLKNNFHFLNEWIRFKMVENFFSSNNMKIFTELLFEEKISVSEIEGVFKKRFYQLWLNEIYTKVLLLNDFKGIEYNNLISDFKKLDSKSLDIARARLQVHLRDNLPEPDMFRMESSVFGILNQEIAKKKKHKPLRKLFVEIKEILFNIKPCFMMSPLSVSQFIDPEKLKFDLVVFDEASQIFPEDAIGAIVRAEQLIVVGDKKQMPPSNFFRFVDSDDSDEYDEEDLPEYESILEECSNMGLPTKMLQWHYRSKDEHLIAFSNKHFYHNRLFTFPNKALDNPAIEFIHVNGTYDMGGSRQNRVEAEKIADLVFEHFRNHYDKLSLGVIAFSETQQMAIISELEKRRMEDQSFESLFESKDSEKFFVKSLEHVQGDERDIIFFSIGYGKNQNNKLSYNFGPIIRTGGERRLNVAITRAKQHIKLISSIRYSDLDLSRINSLGGKLLRNYLEYAELGKSAIYGEQEVTEHLEFDSPFEEHVYEEITNMGYTVRSQVGSSGYRIDLAIVDPENPGSFLLGVECDGATYHSSKTARDRDRLRQQVLESLGWRIHRIWSRDWVSNQPYELQKIKEAIEKAKKNRKQVTDFKTKTNNVDSLLEDVKDKEEEKEKDYKLKKYYPYTVDIIGEPNEFHPENNNSKISNLIYKIVSHSSPIHLSVLTKKVAEAWQMNKISSKIQNKVNNLVKNHSHVWMDEDEFIWIDGMNKAQIKLPGVPRDVTEICKEEFAEAALFCLKDSISADREELIKVVAKLYEFIRVTSAIREKIGQSIDLYISKDYFIEEDNLIKINQ